ncbi:uncharacterized protein LOC142239748 [Haematobia irritans]|uniref:uncharacterized protein LOC142239748 n=1 Tax=Haematobia irritans TaxID=7368 RepID=UPI003F4F874F
MARYGFNLRKWSANHIQLLHNIPECDQEVSLDFTTEDTNYTKTLGLAWLPKADQLKVKVNLTPIRSVTKRTVTSDLAHIFDPLGLLSPVVVRAKMFVQELWNLNLSWDEAVPSEFDYRWRNFRDSLKSLETFPVHRHVYKGHIFQNTQLHIFSDASEKAYGAAVYIRTILPNKIILVNLLCAKYRVAPLKQQTLPRLELCAAHLGANLAVKVKRDLDMMTVPTSSSFQTFVANRIASIQDNTTPEQWRHVSSKDNPADIISRGLDPHQLPQTTQWMHGPFFLHGDEKHWPPAFLPSPDSIITERKQNLHNLMLAVDAENFLYRINHRNSFKTLQRIVAYVLRFIKNSKTRKEERQNRPTPTPFELHDSLIVIVRIAQHSNFKEDILQLENNREFKSSSQIKSLSQFSDEHSVLRVGGRLEEST